MRLQAKFQLQIFKQGKQFVAYTPALDLSTSGRTEKEAKARFSEILDIFFEELVEAGTLDVVLKNLGWQKERSQWQPPKIVSHQEIKFSIPQMA